MRSIEAKSSRHARRLLAVLRRIHTPCIDVLEDRTLLGVLAPFTPTFSTKTTGDITFAANTLLTAGGTSPSPAAVQSGTAAPVGNNDNEANTMVYVNVDPGGGRFDSSSADLILPAGATVLFAGLDWGGTSTSPLANQALFKTPTLSGYETITATTFDTYLNTASGNVTNYAGFTDVTSLVKAGGSGTYTVANVRANTGLQPNQGYYAGWALVVAYSAPGFPARDLTVFDGYAAVQNTAGNSSVQIPISGFGAPPVGPVNATIGVVAYEGDIGISGDSMMFNSTTLSNPTSPSNNFFNSGISSYGVPVTTKSPNFLNQTGIDAKLISANGIIPPNATSATLTLATTQDFYLPRIVTTSISLGDADLGLTKTVDDLTPNVGDTISFTVGLTNYGPDIATGVTVADTLPAGLQFVSATPSQGTTYDPSTGIWTVGTVTEGPPPLTLVIQARVVGPGEHTNIATIDHSDQYDPNPGNNTAADTVTPQEADLALAKEVDNPTPNVGQNVTYTIFLTNIGPDTATSVTVTDSLPAGLQFVSATTTQGSYDDATGIWTVGTVTVGATPLTLTIVALVTTADAAVNVATIDHSDQYDPDSTNNTASAPTEPTQADLAVYKFVNDPRPNVGNTITFTVDLWNYGPSTATSVTVSDPLPAGLQFVSATTTLGSYDDGTGVWTVGTVDVNLLAPAETLAIQALVVSPNPQTNTASVLHSDQDDPNPDNNSSSASVTPQIADLAVTKTVDNATPSLGDTVIFTITINNLGPDNATSVTVQDLLPAGLQFVSATPSGGTYDQTTGIWTVGTVVTAMPQSLVIQAIVVTTGTLTNIATITHSDQYDPNPTNNVDNSIETVAEADLALVKAVSDPTPSVGDTITFFVGLTNLGPSTATGVTVADTLPTGLQFVSATPSQGTYNPSTGIWTVGTVTVDEPLMMVIEAIVVSPVAQTNVATIYHSDQIDANPNNNTDSIVVVPLPADLQITKTANVTTIEVGGTLNYTLLVTNAGPGASTNVTVRDILPPGVQFVSATVAPTSQAGGTLVFNLGTLAAGASAAIDVNVVAEMACPVVNVATVSGSALDPDTSNNVDVETTIVTAAFTGVLSLQRFGYHAQPTALVLAFSTPLDPVSAQDVANYQLFMLGSHGVPKHRIRIGAADYDSTTDTVTLLPVKRLALLGDYRLVVNGTTAAGVRNLSGQLIDGDGNGVPGGNYVQRFSGGILAGPFQSVRPPAASRHAQKVAHEAQRTHVVHERAHDHVAAHRSAARSTSSRDGRQLVTTAVDLVLGSLKGRM